MTANIPGLPEWGTVALHRGVAVRRRHGLRRRGRPPPRRPPAVSVQDQAISARRGRSLVARAAAKIEGYLHVVREDPRRQGLLYLGSEHGLFVSRDDGGTWQPLKLNLPTVAVTDLVVKDNDLVVGTNGRSIWILDDLTPLRQWKPNIKDREIFFFPAAPAVRYRYHTPLGAKKPLGAGQNPPPGAILHYSLKTRPKDDITLEILDDKGQRVALLTSKKEAEQKADPGDYSEKPYKKPLLPREPGLHRIVWDLRHEGAEFIKGAKVDSGEPREGPLVNPGTYTLKLTVAGQTRTTKLQVSPDPRTISPAVWARTAAKLAGTDQPLTPESILQHVEWPAQAVELKEQTQFALKIRDDITSLARIVEQIRKVKGQLVARNELLKDDARAKSLMQASRDVLARLDALEEKLHNPKAKIPYDILAQKGGARLYSQLVWLFEMMKDSDGAPTQGIRELFNEQSELLGKYQVEWRALVMKELAALNEQAKKLDVPAVLVPSFMNNRR